MATVSNTRHPRFSGKRSYSESDTKEFNSNSELQWEDGEIAFLRDVYEFNAADYESLIATRYLHINTTCHPVIILAHSEDYEHYLVTTISAYGSNQSNGYVPPWRQRWHQKKYVDGFRAFEGSERPNKKFPLLRLADGKYCPKIRTSWVYIHHTFVVPATTLKIFDKSPYRLRMAPESLTDLLEQMKSQSHMYQTESIDPRLQPSGASNIVPRLARSTMEKSRSKPRYHKTPAPSISAPREPPTPPSSCPSSPDPETSYSQILRGRTTTPTTPPLTPESPKTEDINDFKSEPAPRPLPTPNTTKASPAPSNASKPLWSVIAAAPTTASSTATAGPRKNQQQAQQQSERRQQSKSQRLKNSAHRKSKSWA
ncbi:hypothetical protein F4775DRAFT_605987 [Biscogniauxia sp. FL1348]|nr:hypothetical protein F4775DRAFT_605987 [Biscogniauxia sp. FL1348]